MVEIKFDVMDVFLGRGVPGMGVGGNALEAWEELKRRIEAEPSKSIDVFNSIDRRELTIPELIMWGYVWSYVGDTWPGLDENTTFLLVNEE